MFIELPPLSLARVDFAHCESGEPDGLHTLTLPPRGRGPRAPGEGSRLLPAARRAGRHGLHAGVGSGASPVFTFTPWPPLQPSACGEHAAASALP